MQGYFEDFQPGIRVHTSGRTITEADIINFAGISGDYNPIHIDVVHAASTQFGQRIAHGLLILSVASGLAMQSGMMGAHVEAFRSLEWKFTAPIFIGDTIRCQITVGTTKPMPRLKIGAVDFDVEIIKQDQTVAMRGIWTVLFKMRPT